MFTNTTLLGDQASPALPALLHCLWQGPAASGFGELVETLLDGVVESLRRRADSSTRFEGCGGLDLSEEMVLTVAAQACMLVLHRTGEPYPELRNVYLYPNTFRSVIKSQDASGVVTEAVVHRLGESWETGTVILAWSSVEHGARNIHDARNVTFHEFAHQLDHEDGTTDGAPGLPSREAYRSWARVFQENYDDFHSMLERGKKTLLDPYGATNPAEFFAVVTETFFEKPKQLRRKRPELYDEMKDFYGLDPEAWLK